MILITKIKAWNRCCRMRLFPIPHTLYAIPLLLLLCAAALPALADGTIHIDNPSASTGRGWTFSDHVVTITANGNYTVAGTSTTHRIVINKDVTARVTLDNAVIRSAVASPFMLLSDSAEGSQVTLILVGNSELTATDVFSAGLTVANNARLTIEGDGSLLAQGAGRNERPYESGGAGIGSGNNQCAGAIIINSGTITAHGGTLAAGIGGGYAGQLNYGGGSIAINGGKIMATGGDLGAGIGGGSYGQIVGNITINGGFVNATGGIDACGIGGGKMENGGSIAINSGVIVAVSPGGIGNPAGIGGGSYSAHAGMISISGGTVYASSGGSTGPSIGGRTNVAGGLINITGGTVIAGAIGISQSDTTVTVIGGQGTMILSQAINAPDFYGATVLTGSNVSVSGDIKTGDVVPDVTLRSNFTIPAGDTLAIPEGIIFDVNHTILTNNGTILNYGSLINAENLKGNQPNTITAGWIQDIPGQAYTGASIEPAVTVKDRYRTLIPDTDYTVGYSGNLNIGTATVTVTGTGRYTGSASKNFTITSGQITGAWIDSIPAQTYSGDSIKPEVTVRAGNTILTPGTDYTAGYSNNINTGTATVTVTGKGRFTGTASKSFTIYPKPVAGGWIQDIPLQSYTGNPVQPVITVRDNTRTLILNTDYTVAYSGNVNLGTATVTITGKGNYTGSASAYFTIANNLITGDWIESIPAQTYTGDSIKPALTVREGNSILTAGVHYTVTYMNNVNAGTATVSVTGRGNYSGTASKSFTIYSKQIAGDWIGVLSAQTYTGSYIQPALTVKDGNNILMAGVHYSATYSNNMNVGTATVTVTGTGNYSGTVYTYFTINPKPVAGSWIGSIPNQTWTGSAIEPAITVMDGNRTLTPNTDYTVFYSNNLNAGTATITLTGLGNYTGTATGTFNIVRSAIPIEVGWVQVIPDQVYTGYSVKPAVTVTGLVQDVDYTVSYYNNTEAGMAIAVITGIGNYTGEVTKSFRIIATGIEEAEHIVLRIVSEDNGVFISGLTPGEVFSIYTLLGQSVYQAKATSPEEHIYLRDKGIYILKHQDRAYKFYRTHK